LGAQYLLDVLTKAKVLAYLWITISSKPEVTILTVIRAPGRNTTSYLKLTSSASKT